jgi:hypothetical protein
MWRQSCVVDISQIRLPPTVHFKRTHRVRRCSSLKRGPAVTRISTAYKNLFVLPTLQDQIWAEFMVAMYNVPVFTRPRDIALGLLISNRGSEETWVHTVHQHASGLLNWRPIILEGSTARNPGASPANPTLAHTPKY